MHPWEPNEITLTARNSYANPYTQVDVWVDLEGPGFSKRVYGFWRGGDRFAVRVVATGPGTWHWHSGASVDDGGLAGHQGSFYVEPWHEEELAANPLRRGFLEPTPNGRALQHPDGTPFFLLGDTWWSIGTWRYAWRPDDEDHGIGPDMGLKEMIRFRKAQGYNCIAIIAALPAWANDGRPATIVADGISIRNAWQNLTTGSAKDMTDSKGRQPFEYPGRVPGYEDVFPDVDRINPAYFDELDEKLTYLNSQGFVGFVEPTRRDHSVAWKKYYDWPESYARFVHYIWSRYGAHNVILSPIHLDYLGHSVPPEDYAAAIDLLLDRYGMPPFVKLVSANPHESVRRNFGNPPWLTLHMAGNGERYHDSYDEWIGEDFRSEPPKPALNGEPHYAGWYDTRGGPTGGTPEDDLDIRSAMYGSVLCGGLAGHIYGASGLWGGDVEPYAKYKMWEGIEFKSGAQLQYVRDFVTSIGLAYRDLVPHRELVAPNETGPARSFRGWVFTARTEDLRHFLMYFEPDYKGEPVVSGAAPGAAYAVKGFDPETGEWLEWAGGRVVADARGSIRLPAPPRDRDLAVRLERE